MSLPFLCYPSSADDASPPRRPSPTAGRWIAVQGSTTESGPDTTDAVLIRGLRAGDARAFRDVWEHYHARLATFALRYVGSSDAAIDVVQDAFVALWEHHASIEVRGSLAGYLYGMVRHLALDVRKHDRVVSQHVEVTMASYLSAPMVAHNLGVDALQVEQLQQCVRRVVGALPPRTREIFLMSREDGLSPSAIASVLRIGQQVVYNQLSRALRALHAAVNEDP